ncbi:hypothetical protein BU17DRAFT_85318 [Hysterangium stoloniferum]|nr:hypothetical protein BU17DRAFT_85318 [Hysterangium stoloniferum]
MLKYSICTWPASKSHGAPITKRKCPKGFHITYATETTTSSKTPGGPSSVGAGIGYQILEEVEKEVVLIDDAMDVDPPNATATSKEVAFVHKYGSGWG